MGASSSSGERKHADSSVDGENERNGVARLRTEPKTPADAQDDAEQADVDAELKTIAERQPAAHESHSCRSIAQPGSRAQQTNVTKPRKGKVVASDRETQSKNRKKPRKGAKKGTRPDEGS